MNQKNKDRLQRYLNKLESQRIMKRSLREIFDLLEVLDLSYSRLTITQIAQVIGRPPSPRFAAFVEGLVLCGYLTRQNTTSETTYSIKRQNSGTMPKPLVPLPMEWCEL